MRLYNESCRPSANRSGRTYALHLVIAARRVTFFFSSRRRHTRLQGDWSSDVCSSDLGLRTGVVTALADNPVGRLIEDLILQGGVQPVHLLWRAYDGIGREVRNGLNFTERGFGVRGAVGCSDHANSAASQLKPGDVDWDAVFAEGVCWFHTGGVFAALSDTTAELALEAARAA